MRAAWLERHDEFEGVGAHELNPRYDDVGEGEHDTLMFASPAQVPKLMEARAFLALATIPIRFDGADISHYQADKGITWPLLRSASVGDWYAQKMTQSVAFLDKTARASRLNARAQKFRHIGLYHWLSSVTDPLEQAAHFIRQTGELAPGEFAMLDAEEGGITQAQALAWCEAVERWYRRPSAVYSGAFVAGGTIWQSTHLREGKFGPRPMILAAYTTEARARALQGVKAYPWSSWQFSSNGPVLGIVGRCDMNRVDDRAVYDRACGLTQGGADPGPVDPVEQGPATTASFPAPTVVTPLTQEEDVPMNAKLLQSESKGIALQLIFADGYTMTGLAGQSVEAVKAGFSTGDPILIDDTAYDDLASKAKQARTS